MNMRKNKVNYRFINSCDWILSYVFFLCNNNFTSESSEHSRILNINLLKLSSIQFFEFWHRKTNIGNYTRALSVLSANHINDSFYWEGHYQLKTVKWVSFWIFFQKVLLATNYVIITLFSDFQIYIFLDKIFIHFYTYLLSRIHKQKHHIIKFLSVLSSDFIFNWKY